ncbi:hypothetical protein FE257_004948 [Aspergillus nanangensis]|uniref:LysM domain-containing protein n=1 Tax=Aspergillus nanangensis TaxID=2582783 RepID=A0AAD4CAT6_ASPNN|nr:hypothetical protein FE257_004948 [Aspergillus nanangensis]
MLFTKATLVSLAANLASGYLVAPAGTAAPGTTASCSKWTSAISGMTCAMVESTWGVTEADFEAWNPFTLQVGSGCNLAVGFYYCVQVNFGGASSTTTTTTTTSTTFATSTTPSTTVSTTTSAGNGISTPTPTQAGMVDNCNAFHMVEDGDTCASIVAAAGITLGNFNAWNSGVGSGCSSLWLGYYVCTGVVGGTATTTSKATTTTAGNGISTPTPTQAGMVANCKSFHMVEETDTCASIASAAGITLANFNAWNSGVGSGCSSLWLGYYVCTGVVGGTTTTKATTTTSAGNGISTPTPTQAGMVSNCKSFHMVADGDTCASIASAAGITLANFNNWNSGVGSGCSSLWLGYYVCTGVVGGTTTTKATTTTTKGNGVSTPTPTQAGMVTNCKTFYKVVDGSTCDSIAKAKGVTVANIEKWNPGVGSTCSSLWLGYYICVGLI